MSITVLENSVEIVEVIEQGPQGKPGSGLEAKLKNYSVAVQYPNLDGVGVVNLSLGNIAKPTLVGDVTDLSIVGWADPGFESKVIFYIEQGATPYQISGWPGNIKWFGGSAPILSEVQGHVDQVVLTSLDSGITIVGAFIGTAF